MIDRACISLGELCNLSCKYCHFATRLTKNSQEFSSEELHLIIDNIQDYCTQQDATSFKIGIVGAGEPLLELDKIIKLMEYVSRFKYSPLTFYLISNGTLFSKDIINFFYQYKDILSVCVSLDGYEELHNLGRSSYNKTIDGIELYEKKFAKKPNINCTVHKQTIINWNKVLEYYQNENYPTITFSKIVDTCDHDFRISQSEYDDFISKSKEYHFSVRQLDIANKEKYDCTMYGKLCGVKRTNIFITKDGVYPCGRFYNLKEYIIGDFNTPIDKIQKNMLWLRDIEKGKCYFNMYVQGEK